MSEHTKWNVGETYDDLHNPTGVTEIEDGSGFVVAFVPRHNGSSRAEKRASFPPMIAAAPELYAALKGLLADIEEYQTINHLGGFNNATQVTARAALAKAEGKATT